MFASYRLCLLSVIGSPFSSTSSSILKLLSLAFGGEPSSLMLPISDFLLRFFLHVTEGVGLPGLRISKSSSSSPRWL